jgi:hypothetical protein
MSLILGFSDQQSNITRKLSAAARRARRLVGQAIHGISPSNMPFHKRIGKRRKQQS